MGKGQNLVPNGDFEQYSPCPGSNGAIENALFWINPSVNASGGGSPDYFNQCSTGQSSVPNNLFGYQPAHSGGGYSGIVLIGVNIQNFREYIEVPLTSPLNANQCYHFEMYINVPNDMVYSSGEVQIYFSNILIDGFTTWAPLPFIPQMNNPSGNYPDTTSWTLVSGNYTAMGGEIYLVIGNFKDDSISYYMISNFNGGYPHAYVYIDDVSLTPCTGIEEQNENIAINIYPNPAKDMFTVSGLPFTVGTKTELFIIDIEGRKVVQQIINNQSSIINIKSLNDGIYFIEINNGNSNGYRDRKKFLKQ
ncbi:MAG: T9SS type A sorting domain-containing protein [Bacteroidota bacterium]